MEVYVYVDYREEKGGEIEFSTPEVYATKEAAERRYNNSVGEIQEEIDEEEPIEEMRDSGEDADHPPREEDLLLPPPQPGR